VSEIQALLEKAGTSLKAAEILQREGIPTIAASRAYYACFYVAQALLLTQGHRFSSHGQVLAGYGRIFARTSKLDRRFHQLLIRAFRVRQTADYHAEPEIEPELADELIRDGQDFLGAAHQYVSDLDL
jgi:uncharacterized protein (UPF0332 family)